MATRRYLSACRDARSAEAFGSKGAERSWRDSHVQALMCQGHPTASFLITAHFVLACLNYSFSLTKTRSPVVGGPGGYLENTEPFDAQMSPLHRGGSCRGTSGCLTSKFHFSMQLLKRDPPHHPLICLLEVCREGLCSLALSARAHK